jgi:peptidoglycan L-alanyl-D-glutamate endopeptidase CwlK
MNTASRAQLDTCDVRLQRLFGEVDRYYPCLILEGHRDEAAQNAAFDEGKSRLKWPDSNHNSYPSRAVDVAPLPLDWENAEEFWHFSGFVLGTAHALRINLRYGGDWDRDRDLRDNKLVDLVHFEIVETPMPETSV